eukprot:2204936-Pleurochrysis_carterae.AAC.3
MNYDICAPSTFSSLRSRWATGGSSACLKVKRHSERKGRESARGARERDLSRVAVRESEHARDSASARAREGGRVNARVGGRARGRK